MIEQAGTSSRVGAGCTGFAQWLAVDRVLELVAAFTIAASLIGLVAALAGIFHAPQVLLGALITTGIYGFKTRGRGTFPDSVPPRWGHLILLVLVALFFRLPAYHYVLGGQDEGLYTNIAQHIDFTGRIDAHDRVMQKLEGSPYLNTYLKDNRILEGNSPTLYLLGVYARQPGTDHLVFQFYYLFAIWMAIVGGLLGPTMAVYALTFFALLSIVFFYRLALLVTRSSSAALVAGGLLALNPLHVFFSKFPVTEMPTIAFSLIGFTLLAAYWSKDSHERRPRWLWLSVLAFFCLFTTRISGFMYIPFFIAMAIASLACDRDVVRRRAVQWWMGGVLIAYFASVEYGLRWSRYYSRDTYLTSFEPLLGHHWLTVVEACVIAGIAIWLGCGWWTRTASGRLRADGWLIRPINRWLGLVVLATLALGLLKVYWLGWTNHYSSGGMNLRWHLSNHGWHSASSTSLWTLCVFIGLPMVVAFLAVVGKRPMDPRVGFLRLFVIGFFVFGIVLQWDVPYSPYYARYLLSELVPYLILFVVCMWGLMRQGNGRKLLTVVLGFSLVYSATLSAMQIGKNEDEGAYAALSRLVAPVDPDDVILLDTLHQQPNTSLVKTPLVYTFHRDVVTVGSKSLSNLGYLAKLDSIYNDVFLISSAPSAPAGFVRIDSVRFRPLTYQHNHSFPHKLVHQADVILYLYRLDNAQIPLDHTLSFASGGPWTSWLQSGWSTPEDWGIWSDAKQAVLAIDPRQLPASAANLVLHLKVVGYVNPRHLRQRIGVSLNGEHVADYQILYPDTDLTMTIPISHMAWRDRSRLSLAFTLPDAASPKSLGRGGDPRALAMGLVSMQVTKAALTPSGKHSKQAAAHASH